MLRQAIYHQAPSAAPMLAFWFGFVLRQSFIAHAGLELYVADEHDPSSIFQMFQLKVCTTGLSYNYTISLMASLGSLW